MTTALLSPPPVAQPAPPAAPAEGPGEAPLYPLSVDQYHQMIRQGILGDRDPVELLNGLLVRKMPEDAVHAAVVELASDALRGILPAGWIVRPAHPITTTDSEPEPDVAVARGTIRDYTARHPHPADCALVVEVANSSVRQDRGPKRRLYAAAGVPAYWIVLLADRAVEVYADPTGPAAHPAYAAVRRYADGEAVPVVIDGRAVGTVAVADLLP